MNRILSYLEGGISSMSHFWYFRELVTIEEMNFNNTLERFYNLGVEGLVRENIQNSLDSKLPEINQPVYVKIKTGVVSDSEIPGIEEVRTHIMHLKAENEYTKETIQHMKDSMRKTKVPYISFEDCNTKGLSGAEHGDEPLKGDTWGAYAYKKGVHNVEDDSILEGSRGGSHGIGKIACNAASDLHMMYFANCDANGKCHIGGTVQLIEHSIQNNNYRSTGYFTQEINGHYYPIVGRVCMDQVMVKVDESVALHDLVEIFGEHIPLSQMAKELDTIPYEIVCLISERVERIYEPVLDKIYVSQ